MSYLFLPHRATPIFVVHGCLPSAQLARITAGPLGCICGPLYTKASGAVAIVYGFHCTPIFRVYASCFLDVFLRVSFFLQLRCQCVCFARTLLQHDSDPSTTRKTPSLLLHDCSLFRALISPSSLSFPPLKLHKNFFLHTPKSKSYP
jgi:hypothetical protein